jgi:hypothetical protein
MELQRKQSVPAAQEKERIKCCRTRWAHIWQLKNENGK